MHATMPSFNLVESFVCNSICSKLHICNHLTSRKINVALNTDYKTKNCTKSTTNGWFTTCCLLKVGCPTCYSWTFNLPSMTCNLEIFEHKWLNVQSWAIFWTIMNKEFFWHQCFNLFNCHSIEYIALFRFELFLFQKKSNKHLWIQAYKVYLSWILFFTMYEKITNIFQN